MSKKIKRKKPSSTINTKQLDKQMQDALSHHQQGDLSKAEKLYKSIVLKNPKHADALNFLGLIAQQKGDFTTSVKLAQKAVSLKKSPHYFSNLGTALRGTKNFLKAVHAFQKALKLDPSLIQAKYNLACTYLDLKEFIEAETAFQSIVSMKPNFIEALEGLGQAQYNQRKYDAALACADRLIELSPENPNNFIFKGSILQSTGAYQQAIKEYQTALELEPDNAIALNNLGNTWGQIGNLHKALELYKKSNLAQPGFIEAATNLAWAYLQHGMLKESLSCYHSLKKIHPDSPEIYSDLLFTMNYDPSLAPADHFKAASDWGKLFGSASSNSIDFCHQPTTTIKRIGFLSPDFRKHPVGFFLEPLIKELHESDLKVYCYAEMTDSQTDSITKSIKSLATGWRQTVNQTDSEVAKIIADDKIDVLIDLAGHSAGNRLPVLGLKPAPLQVNWLGYVNTTGLPQVDYRITDQYADPKGSESHYSESLFRLPDGFFCYSPPEGAPEISPLPALKKGYITLGSYNNLVKINPTVIKLWSDILHAIPSAQLQITSRPLGDKFIRNRYKQFFVNEGIDPKRIVLNGASSLSEYLASHQQIDITLDTFPHNGHTISCNSLWMGVPFITMHGDRYATRMGASVLTLVNLKEFIAKNPKEYIEKVVKLASGLDFLENLRLGMRDRMNNSPMCQPQIFAKNFTNALNQMWEEKVITNKP